MAESALRNLQRERMNERRARIGMEPFVPQAPTKTAGQAMADMLGGMSIPLSAVPVAGDIAGLAADAAMYATRPEERTFGNAAMTLAGLLPFVPGASAARMAGNVAEGALDMSQAARMQRAQEMGFDTSNVFFHGSGEDFDFFDPLKMGKTDEGWFGKGFYFSPDPNVANQYAAGRSPNVQQVFLKASNPYDWRMNEGVGMRLGTPEERWAKTKEIMDAGYDSVDVYQDTIKLGEGQKLSDDAWLKLVKRSLEMGDPVMPRSMVEDALRVGMSRDDVARYYGEEIAQALPAQRKLVERVVFRPEQVRSINAAFDPAKRNSANLMAGIAVAPVGVSALRALIPQEGQE